MSKRIIVTESQYRLLKEYQDELTYYKFYVDVLRFLKELLDNPSDAKVSDVLKNHGITREKLIQGLVDRNVLSRKNKVIEVPKGEKGKMTSKMLVKYSVLRKNFEKNLHKLHIELCECVKPSVLRLENEEDFGTLEEEGMGGAMSCGNALQGGGTSFESGEFVQPIAQVQRREIYNPKPKKKKKK